MMPAINCVKPPNNSAVPNTPGFTLGEIRFALTMLSMNVVTPKAASASGAELPQFSCVGFTGRTTRSASRGSDRVRADRGGIDRVGAAVVAMRHTLLPLGARLSQHRSPDGRSSRRPAAFFTSEESGDDPPDTRCQARVAQRRPRV